MPNKALTILIADDLHLQRLYIEKMLNQLGYHRIVPVQTFEEVQILTAIPAEPFDVLIINAGLAAHASGPHPQARHVLVYDHLDLNAPADAMPTVSVRLPGVPDNVNLEHFHGNHRPAPRHDPLAGFAVVKDIIPLAGRRSVVRADVCGADQSVALASHFVSLCSRRRSAALRSNCSVPAQPRQPSVTDTP